MKRALICGVTGQDGAFLARLLLEKQYHVIGVSRNIRTTSFKNLERLNICDRVEKISATMVDFRNVIELIYKYQPDEIYHLSGRSSVAHSFSEPFDTFESIAMAVLNLLEAVRILKLPVKLFNAGSSECFGIIEKGRATEQTPFRPKSPYGVAKAAAFWQIASYRKIYGLFACTGILFNHESFLRPERFVTRKIVKTACKIAKGQCSELVLGNISIERDWGWAPEYVEAMWKMLQQDIPDDYIIATGTTMSLEKFIATVFQRLDLDWKKYVKTDSRFFRPSDIHTNSANPEKAEKKLGWKARYTGEDVAKMMVDAELKNMQGK
jgi:GDPmannose 4,6-dehydratase